MVQQQRNSNVTTALRSFFLIYYIYFIDLVQNSLLLQNYKVLFKMCGLKKKDFYKYTKLKVAEIQNMNLV